MSIDDMALDGVPVLDVDPYDLVHAADPYLLYAIVREAAPIVYLSRYDCYATGRYDAVRRILEDWRNFTSTTGVGLQDLSLPDAFRPRSPLVEVDPPDHTAVKSVCLRIISPRVIRGWREDFERAAAALVEGLLDHATIDGVRDIAEAYVTTVFPHALGIDANLRNRDNLIAQGNYSFTSLGPHNELFAAAKAKFMTIWDWYFAAQKRQNLLPEGFGAKLFVAEDAGELPPGVARGVMANFMGGGLHTTISALGSMIMHLSRQPDIWARLRADRSLVKLPFEETLRLETPSTTWYRATTGPVMFDGAHLRPRTKVHLLTASANRDPRRWKHPERFDIDRSASGHLGLGRGVHACIGQMIARLEAECLLTAMLDRIAAVAPAGEPAYRPLNNLRTLDVLPLAITAA